MGRVGVWMDAHGNGYQRLESVVDAWVTANAVVL